MHAWIMAVDKFSIIALKWSKDKCTRVLKSKVFSLRELEAHRTPPECSTKKENQVGALIHIHKQQSKHPSSNKPIFFWERVVSKSTWKCMLKSNLNCLKTMSYFIYHFFNIEVMIFQISRINPLILAILEYFDPLFRTSFFGFFCKKFIGWKR